ncbi:alginate export family protein [Fulvivirga sediminis]|uniref:Alginate export family protein n=1 Tax=Fulvivirga sediminis TaxID=2803949 RepID=A0A937K009_9BACT|nr:alginate export family protein [Fulvivirga sediminis]MBL3655855.1 alginate export family protein [Fulvivirga sediminis]
MKKTLLLLIFFGSIAYHAQAQFTVSGDFRFRSELRDGSRVLLDSTKNASVVSSQRTRLITNYKFDRFEIRVAFQNARIWGQDRERANVPNLNMAEGWLRYKLNEDTTKGFFVKVGRQHLVLDDGRIFGMRNWNDIAVSHDLALLEYENKGWNIIGGGAYNNDANKYFESAYEVNYYKYLGLVWVNKQINEKWQASLLNSVEGHEDEDNYKVLYPRATSGVYLKKDKGDLPLSLQASFYYQYGKNPVGVKQNAYMYSIVPTYHISKKWKTTFGVNYLSGNDQTKASDKNEAFNKLFGDGHRYYGYMDYFLNIEDNSKGGGMRELFAGLFYNFTEKTQLELSYHNFGLAGTLVNPDNGNKVEGQLGHEIDLQLKHSLGKAVTLVIDYSTMFATEEMEYLKGGDHTRYQQWANVMLIAKPQFFKSK